jgi:O-antigen ligase
MTTADASKRLDGIARWLFAALIASLPLMNPPISYPVVIPDLVFALLFGVVAAQALLGRRAHLFDGMTWIVLAYVASLCPSVLASPNPELSLFKLLTDLYLAALALVTARLAATEQRLRAVVLAWLGATAFLSLLALASLASFAVSSDSWLYRYSEFHFGTLPPGDYPRLALSFLNGNLACNYLTVSVGLLFAARGQRWISARLFYLLLAGAVIAALTTISPGLGGVALALGFGFYVEERGSSPRSARLWLWLGIVAAAAFVPALALTPIAHPTATFVIRLPHSTLQLEPAGRFLTWSAAAAEFMRHPLIGHGIGINAVHVRYDNPSGEHQLLWDAHNIVLSIAAQAGIIGLAGLAALVGYACRLTFRAGAKNPFRLTIGVTFLNAFVYQGIGGSFENTRHLWVLLGLLIAAARLDLSRADGNNRTAGAPSLC